ncbi:MAG TPA: ABC transporter permease [Gemmatimonadaceae bacterium]|nr:ABC transporter permease [Gemmatimonadaceae bacterium]
MGKMLVVFKREYLERVRSKWFLVATFLGPVFMGLITVLPIVLAARTKSSSNLSNVVVLDATGTDLGQRVAHALQATTPGSPAPQVRVVMADKLSAEEDRATQQVVNREVQGFLVLNDSTLLGRSLTYAGRNATSLVDVESITAMVRQSLLDMRLEKEGIDPARVAMLTAVKLNATTEKITDKGREAGGGMSSFFFAYGIAFVLYFMIAIYGQNMMRGVMEEKTTRVAEVVISSAKPDALLAGKILGVGLVAITQVVIWIAAGIAMYRVRAPLLARFGVSAAAASGISIPAVSVSAGLALLAFFLLGFIFYASLFAAVGAMVSSQEDVQQAAMPVTLLLVSSIVFMQPVLINPASTMAKVMSWLPFSAPIIMPLRMALISVSWLEIGGTLAGVALGCLAAIWLSARIYRVGLLMYGKRPSLAELVKWIRMA